MKVIKLIPLNEGRQDALDHALALLRVELQEEEQAAEMEQLLRQMKVQYEAMGKAAANQNRFRFYMLAFHTARLMLNSYISHQYQKFAAA